MRRKSSSAAPSSGTSSPDQACLEACRLDVWLYRTRLLKTRSGATKLIHSGKVRLTRNGQTERTRKPHTLVRRGDGVTFMRGSQLIDVIMIGAGTRRGPAPEAQLLYDNIGQNHDKRPYDKTKTDNSILTEHEYIATSHPRKYNKD